MNLATPNFSTPLNGQLATLATPYVPGAGALVLSDATRIAAATPSPASPVRLTVESTDGLVVSQFLCVQQPAGTVVSVTLVEGYVDAGLPAGSAVGVSWTAEAALEVQDAILAAVGAINAIQASASGVASVNGETGAVSLTASNLPGLGTIATHAAGDYLTPTGSGSGLTALNASALASGAVPPARMGSGTPSASNYLRGDGSWSTPPPSPVQSVAGRTGAVVLSTADVSGLATVASTGAYGDLSGRPTLGTLASQNGTFSGTSSGTNTGDQTSISGQAGTVATIAGLLSAGTGVTIDGAGTAASPYMIAAIGGGSGSTSPGGVTGSIQFATSAGTFGGDAGNLFWDATNHRLGIGTGTPAASLTVSKAGRIDSLPISSNGTFNYHCQITDSGNNALFSIFSAYSGVYNRYNAAGNPSQRFDVGLNNGQVLLNSFDDSANQSLPIVINGKGLIVVGSDTTTSTRTTKAAPGQFADLDQWQDAAGNALSGVSASGYVRSVVGSGPPSATPPDGSIYLDNANGKLYIRTGSTWKSATLS